jgi:CDP-diacylglycerol--glycerol-3-phosphate 3-phosphatidyltransferase
LASIYDLKPAFQNLLRPITRALAGAGVTANAITLLAVGLSAVVGAFIATYPNERWPLILVGPWLFVRMALNAIDGMLAREHGQKSALGGMLNELGDVVADAALYLPFGLLPGFSGGWVVAVVFLSVLTEMAGVVSAQIGGSRRYDGPFGKSDRAFAFGARGLALGLGVPRGPWIPWLFIAMAILSALTIVNRARRALAER